MAAACWRSCRPAMAWETASHGETGARAAPLPVRVQAPRNGRCTGRADGMPLPLRAFVNPVLAVLLLIASAAPACARRIRRRFPGERGRPRPARRDVDLREPADRRVARPGDWPAAGRSRGGRGAGARSAWSPAARHRRSTTRAIPGGVLLVADRENVLMLAPADVDVLSGETLEGAARAAAARLQVALAETAELRAPGRMIRAVSLSLAITAVLAGLLWLLRRLDRVARPPVRAISRSGGSPGHRPASPCWPRSCVDVLLPRASGCCWRLPRWRSSISGWRSSCGAFLHAAVGESLRALLVNQLSALGGTIVDAAPGLFAVALIIVAARWVSKAVALLFDAVERGRLSLPGVYPDTAAPTRRLVIAGVWMSALAMAYPYIPGATPTASRASSVFVGVILSFGSDRRGPAPGERADADVRARRARGRLRADRRRRGHHPADRRRSPRRCARRLARRSRFPTRWWCRRR